MDTEDKLGKLLKRFPEYEKESLLEILISCDGCLKATFGLLGDDSFEEAETVAEPAKEEDITSVIKEEPVVEKPALVDQENTVSTVDRVQLPNTLKRKNEDAAGSVNSLCKLLKPSIPPVSATNQTITLKSVKDIESVLPLKVIPNFLPQKMADDILKSLISQKMLFKAKEFYIAGNLCRSTQKTIFFTDDLAVDYDPTYKSDEMKSVKFTPDIKTCQAYIDDKVNEVLGELYNDKEKPSYLIDSNWESNFCVANYYQDNKSHLDWHTDKLTNIGPLPTIASMTLGSTRLFRLRRIMPTNSIIYNIPISHNTLLLMLPSTQELYRHCVPTLKNSMVERHPVAGEARFNLTFRMGNPYIQKNLVMCDKCKTQMILRRLFKGDNIGYYVWLCMSSFKGVNCKGFKYARFDDIHDYKDIKKISLEAKDKNHATRWLSELEST